MYTNHGVSVTLIMLRPDTQVSSRLVMANSGHRSEGSLRNYNVLPSSESLRACSNILSEALRGRVRNSQQPNFPYLVTSSKTAPREVVIMLKKLQVFMSHNPVGFHHTFNFKILCLD